MTPAQLREARLRLGLTLEQMARMLGFEGSPANLRQMAHRLEIDGPHGRRIREPHRRLVEAMLAGWRPSDWPL